MEELKRKIKKLIDECNDMFALVQIYQIMKKLKD